MEGMHRDLQDDWQRRLENLKKVHTCLFSYLETTLHLHHPLLTDQFDLPSLARNFTRSVLLKLLQLTMLAIIHCVHKPVFISRIMTQSEETQTHIMFFIQRILERGERNPVEEEIFRSSASELVKVRRQKKTIEAKLSLVESRVEETSNANNSLDTELAAVKTRNLDLERALHHRDKCVSAQSMQDTLLASLEDCLTEKEQVISSLRIDLAEARRRSKEEITGLKDELDVERERAGRLAEAEEALRRYKKKWEKAAEDEMKLTALQGENDRLRKLVIALKTEAEANSSAVKQAAALREELMHLTDALQAQDSSLQDKDRQLQELRASHHDLEERLQLSDQKTREANEQLDKLFVTDNSSEDSFTVRSPAAEEYRRRRNTLQGTIFLERDSLSDSKRLKEVMTLFNELAQVKVQKTKLEDELRAVKTALSGEVARAETEQKASKALHKQEVQELCSKLELVENDFAHSMHTLQTEKSELMGKLQFAELRLGQVAEDLKAGKKERETLAAEARSLRKDKEELTTRYMESREQEMVLITRLSEFQVLHQTAESERIRLAQRLDEGTFSPRAQSESECAKLRSQVLSLERKVLSLECELSESQVYGTQKAVKAKDEELKKHKLSAEQIRQLQHEATKWRHLSIQKDSDISYLTRAKDELTKALSEERKLLFEVMQEMDTRISDISGSRSSKHYHS